MGCLYQHTHTYANILREGCFCLNFLSLSYYDRLVATIHQNEVETDEFQVGEFSAGPCRKIHAPAIREAFLNMECSLHSVQDLSGAGITAMVTGKVENVWVEEGMAQGYRRHGEQGFPLLFPGPQDLVTGAPNPTGIATLQLQKLD